MLYGRATELAAITKTVAEACAHRRSGALVIRGEAGIGKSALLDRVADLSAEMSPETRVLRATGVQAEATLAFAGLHQLVWPVRDHFDRLPPSQAGALREAFGSGAAHGHDLFLIGLAVLTLLADLAEKGPVVCLVDDAHWLDRATAEALPFVARRLAAEGVVMIFAAREDEGFAASGLPEIALSRLGPEDARALLAERGGRPLSPAVRDRIVAASAGNPLALIEFGAAQLEEPRALGRPAVTDRVLASFQGQIGRLSERARLMLLILAAEARGHLPTVLGAATALGVGLEDLEEAEKAGLVRIAGRVTGTAAVFRHPLILAAAYQGVPLARRVAVHEALAATATDPDCRARHRAAAAVAPDESVAAELDGAALRARAKCGLAEAARLYEQAAELTPAPAARSRRLAGAAELALRAGDTHRAAELAGRAAVLDGDPVDRARAALVNATVEFEHGDPLAAARLLLDPAHHPGSPGGAVPADRGTPAVPDGAQAMARAAATYAWFAGDAPSIRAASALSPADPLVRALTCLVDDDYAAGLPLLADLLTRDDTDWMHRVHAAVILGADDVAQELAAAETERCRRLGLAGRLPRVLHQLAQAQLLNGLRRDAEATAAEGIAIAADTGQHRRIGRINTTLARIAAMEGNEARLRELTEHRPDAGGVPAECGLSLLDLGMGRHRPSLERLERAWLGPGRHTTVLMAAVPDQVEAAVRLGEPERAAQPLARFRTWAQAGGQSWARAVALRCRALVDDDGDLYAQAVRLHEQGGRPFERARTELLYGEWLRRARRRSEARVPLRSALRVFERLGATPWTDRARAELKATGESLMPAEATAADLLDRLTPQELQVVRLAVEGRSSREIAAQLFLSPRTVEYHLYKAYPKLGVSSRRELALLRPRIVSA
ncbi:transcriptional regulator [Planobispora rosea]|uniref:Transcriptional regulator n=1 Tax=Planobispora rosea TaxID=35762 RepID=A0A8J3WAA3_PLARO|nr:LuxR family transcriptional regulator [Planobispora rosea]GGS75578.1 transcriptional regulator [Planobispora rosea]GIH81875.1 transcriptional regulator [Planobispora rosea]